MNSIKTTTGWHQQEAIALAVLMEEALRAGGHTCGHVALTGGCLYRWEGEERKDVDYVIYSHRGYELNRDKALHALSTIPYFVIIKDTSISESFRVRKAEYGLGKIDLFFPELTYEDDVNQGEEDRAAGRPERGYR